MAKLPRNGVFEVQCRGRSSAGKKVFKTPQSVWIFVRVNESRESLTLRVDCPYNTGAHEEGCGAEHPDAGKDHRWRLPHCPFSVDLPHAIGMGAGGKCRG